MTKDAKLLAEIKNLCRTVRFNKSKGIHYPGAVTSRTLAKAILEMIDVRQ
jgi:hypothetical protein